MTNAHQPSLSDAHVVSDPQGLTHTERPGGTVDGREALEALRVLMRSRSPVSAHAPGPAPHKKTAAGPTPHRRSLNSGQLPTNQTCRVSATST